MKNTFNKPEGLLGRIIATMMNKGHARLSAWGFSHINADGASSILDLGCGGGANVASWLRRCPQAKVWGIDLSQVCVSKARRVNRSAIESCRCNIEQGDVSRLPFENGRFDWASAFETIYFWPGLEKCFAEVRRVLKDGGSFFICNESDGTGKLAQKMSERIPGMRLYREEDIAEALRAAGFTDIQFFRNDQKSWLCVIAKAIASDAILIPETICRQAIDQ